MTAFTRVSLGWLVVIAAGCSHPGRVAPGDGDAAAPDDVAVDSPAPCNIYSGDAGAPAGVPMFLSPEGLRDNPTVMAATAALQKLAAGAVFVPSFDDMPPDITGTVDTPQGVAKLLATSDGTQLNLPFGASEGKIAAFCHDVVQLDTISTINGVKVTSATSLAYLRGSGQSYTTYGVTIGVCADVPFTYILANITAGQIDRAHGKISQDSLLVTLDTEGTISATCASHLVHALQKPSGWALIQGSGTITDN